MRQERLLILFFITLLFSLASLRYLIRLPQSSTSMKLMIQAMPTSDSTPLKQALISLDKQAWFALKLNADPILYLNSLHSLLKKVPIDCLDAFYEGDLLRVIMTSSFCKFSRTPLDGKTHRALDLAISINHAKRIDLIAVPQIGPKLAQKIIENRPYSSLDELLNLSGVGFKRLANLKPFLTCDEPKQLWSKKTLPQVEASKVLGRQSFDKRIRLKTKVNGEAQ